LYQTLNQRLQQLSKNGALAQLKHSLIGLEKENLRVDNQGYIAQTPHPHVLGSALTHPHITTDYSEALLELITAPYSDFNDALHFLCHTQQFIYQNLHEELLWATSMPCMLNGDASIPIAEYGTSNAGKMRNLYRRGLGHRYGRVMQTIAGVHFNYSFNPTFWVAYHAIEGSHQPLDDFISTHYFALIRNLQRVGWLIFYLFGASPAVCQSFLHDHEPIKLARFGNGTYYEPFGTSMRLGEIGYQNSRDHDTGMNPCYDDVESYVKCLTYAIETPCPIYREIGVKVDGEYRQLNANILQIENEYYSTVRPKPLSLPNEKPTAALQRGGVKYIELRSLDINAYEPLGINAEQVRFLQLLLPFCLLHDSPPISRAERIEIDHNQQLTAHQGRDPKLQLQRNGQPVALTEWGLNLCDLMQPFAEALDADATMPIYQTTLANQRARLHDAALTPSAQILAEMQANKESFFEFAWRLSLQHRDYFVNLPSNTALQQQFTTLATQSHQQQAHIEATDTLSFDDYLQHYFAQTLPHTAPIALPTLK